MEKISKSYSIDLADAFQIITMKKGFPSSLEGDSKTIFITGDPDDPGRHVYGGTTIMNTLTYKGYTAKF